ncbi:ABC transporter substrate-binding protein [Pseudoroseicyclus aestuarii]|uniref:Peptide/nickel transport system substrate-binding protein n=1 Tax=Pseudoroseicyclus aestuarii TaxID=1795041 RepID=A0A318SQN8_9RHOB|nr:ABC transporter substrate-binding protein [Pseudoroseicyclus aestuarii]PYE84013.1 peptide/nickel transport system substrate-binding protein [Pseudoroseicyclus aestuarii]
MDDYTKFLTRQVARGRMGRREFMGRSLAAGLGAAAAPLFASAASAQEAQKGGHLLIALNGGASTDSLDPAAATGSVMFTAVQTWGDTLVESDPVEGTPVPNLAESWTPSADATEWTFKIRQGVTFHDGSPFTVDDAVATLQRHTDAESQSGALGLLQSITGIENRGGDLVITLDAGNADLPLILTDYHLIMQPNGGRDAPDAAIGTGPYKLETAEQGVRLTFTRNEDDWRDDRGHVDSAEILVINDNTARVAALSSGRVHFASTIAPKTVPLLQRAPNVEILTTSGKGYYSFLMHCDTAPFDNNDLRMALKLAIDREAMLQQVLGGFGTIGNDFPVNEAYALFPEGIEQRTYDPEQAADYYRRSGHEGPITLRTSDVAFPGAVDAAVLFQQNAAEAGIELNIVREPEDGYWSNVWNVQPFSASYWGGRPTQDSRYSTNFLSSAEWNDTNFFRDDFDAMLLEARAELDTERREELYRDMALMVRDEGGAIIPVFNDYINAASANLMGYVDDIGNDFSSGRMISRVWLNE